MIHIFQQLRERNPDFDVFSADAVKAFYNLNRDLAMKKLKEEAHQVFNLFVDKYNNSSYAFFFGLAQGVARFTQSEGGSPGSPEMNFLYELGVSDFVQKLNLSRKSLNVYWDAARIELTQPCITTLFFIRLGTEIDSQLLMFIQELDSQPGFRLKFLRWPMMNLCQLSAGETR